MNNSEQTFAIHPYKVGTKSKRGSNGSLAFVVPIKARQMCNIDASSIILLKVDGKNKIMTLQVLDEVQGNRQNDPFGKKLNDGAQNVPTGVP